MSAVHGLFQQTDAGCGILVKTAPALEVEVRKRILGLGVAGGGIGDKVGIIVFGG